MIDTVDEFIAANLDEVKYGVKERFGGETNDLDLMIIGDVMKDLIKIYRDENHEMWENAGE